MPEFLLIVDASDAALQASQILREDFKRVHIAKSEEEARAFIDTLDPRRDDLIAIVDARFVDEPTALRRVLRMRPFTTVATVREDDAADPRGWPVVRRPYEARLADQCEAILVTHRMNRILVHLVSILIKDENAPAGEWSGSGCLVRLPKRDVILTAEHVVRRMSGTQTSIAANGPPIDITPWPIVGRDRDVDIATIAVPHGFDPQIVRSQYYLPPVWPPSRAEQGNAVHLVGFPSEHRLPASGQTRTSYAALIADFVVSVSTKQFVSAPEKQERMFGTMASHLGSIEDIGGMSGGPMFVGGYRERMQLRGVLKEGDGGQNATVFGAHADFVRADGTIDDALLR